jgi:hypothetical protein
MIAAALPFIGIAADGVEFARATGLAGVATEPVAMGGGAADDTRPGAALVKATQGVRGFAAIVLRAALGRRGACLPLARLRQFGADVVEAVAGAAIPVLRARLPIDLAATPIRAAGLAARTLDAERARGTEAKARIVDEAQPRLPRPGVAAAVRAIVGVALALALVAKGEQGIALDTG